MYHFLISIVIGAFLALLFFNLYFRAKVLKVYKRLVQNEVQFNSAQLLNKKRLEEEVLHKYPKHKEDILLFGDYIRRSVFVAVLLVLLIVIASFILNYYR
jgi:hypothetical protein